MNSKVGSAAAVLAVLLAAPASAAPAALPSAVDAVANVLTGQCLADQTHTPATPGSINVRAVGKPAGPRGAQLQLSPTALRIPTAGGEAYYQNDAQLCLVYGQGLDAAAAAAAIETALLALPGHTKKVDDVTTTGPQAARTMHFILGDEGLPAVPLVMLVYPIADPHSIAASVRITRQVNLTADSAPGWTPSDDQSRQLVDAIHRYLDAKDHGRSAEAYGMLAADLQQKQSLDAFRDEMGQFNTMAGPVKERRIVRITWTKDPAQAAAPGVYAVADLVSRFNGVDLHCGYLVLYQPPQGGPFVIAREESTFIDNAAARRIRQQQSQAAVDAAWKQMTENCPYYPGPDAPN